MQEQLPLNQILNNITTKLPDVYFGYITGILDTFYAIGSKQHISVFVSNIQKEFFHQYSNRLFYVDLKNQLLENLSLDGFEELIILMFLSKKLHVVLEEDYIKTVEKYPDDLVVYKKEFLDFEEAKKIEPYVISNYVIGLAKEPKNSLIFLIKEQES
jgi:hypothetical protein